MNGKVPLWPAITACVLGLLVLTMFIPITTVEERLSSGTVGPELTIEESLASTEDAGLRYWLLAYGDTAQEPVRVAYLVDRLLFYAEEGCIQGFLAAHWKDLAQTERGLRELGLAATADEYDAAVDLLLPAGQPKGRAQVEQAWQALEEDQAKVERMEEIERRIHAEQAEIVQALRKHIKLNLQVFKKLE